MLLDVHAAAASRRPVLPAPRDPVGAAAYGGRSEAAPDADVLRQAAVLCTAARDGQAEAALELLLGLVRSYPACDRLQILAARLLEETHQGAPEREAELAAAWRGVNNRFPDALEPFRMVLRWTQRRQGRLAALALLRERFPEQPRDPAKLALYAWGQEELRCIEAADHAFATLVAGSVQASAYLHFARALIKRGEIWRACRVLDEGLHRAGDTPALVRLRVEAAATRRRIEAVAPGARDGRGADAVLAEIFGQVTAQRGRPARRSREAALGPITLITGSLGAGGAERQFALTARALQTAADEGRPIAGRRLAGSVDVVCRSLRARPGGDFFAAGLRAAGIPIREYAGHRPTDGGSVLAAFEPALSFLPGPVVEGLIGLADDLRARAPRIVHIWQDGSILAAGLAALMAGVPRIVLTVRSLPPIDRPERYRPEYEVVFRALLAAPGVSLTANSRTAARRYAEWLGLPPQRVAVIYNGVDPLPPDVTPAEAAMAAAFDAATPEADFTVGTVMRLDENKRPLLWLDVAARTLRCLPGARFVIIGDGPLREDCLAYARQLGIAERVLFVPRSPSVGYWLRRMDAFMLLSLVEGLPNVLIEAQHAGVPVIATDAGGAAETIRPGETGLLLPPGPDLDPALTAGRLADLAAAPDRRAAMGAAARIWAAETFSVSAMLERTVRSYAAVR